MRTALAERASGTATEVSGDNAERTGRARGLSSLGKSGEAPTKCLRCSLQLAGQQEKKNRNFQSCLKNKIARTAHFLLSFSMRNCLKSTFLAKCGR